MIRTVAMGEDEPGLRPLSAASRREDSRIRLDRLVESFARHSCGDRHWQEKGFGELQRNILPVAPETGAPRHSTGNGRFLAAGTVTGGATSSDGRWCARGSTVDGSIPRNVGQR